MVKAFRRFGIAVLTMIVLSIGYVLAIEPATNTVATAYADGSTATPTPTPHPNCSPLGCGGG